MTQMKVFTIGYGGRSAEEFIGLLRRNGVRTIVDVRLRPDRASMGIWVKAKTAEKGIPKLLGAAGIEYRSFPELGNLFLEYPDWQERYRQLLAQAGDLLLSRLSGFPEPYCLLCAEKRVADCHRLLIAEHLARTQEIEIQHLE
jgi:uncharacterized protein (DUF488 family)